MVLFSLPETPGLFITFFIDTDLTRNRQEILKLLPHIHAALRAEGQRCGKKRVARRMRELGLSARPRKHRSRTADSQHEQPVAPNLLNRDFTVTAPNTRWVADITAIWTSEG